MGKPENVSPAKKCYRRQNLFELFVKYFFKLMEDGYKVFEMSMGRFASKYLNSRSARKQNKTRMSPCD